VASDTPTIRASNLFDTPSRAAARKAAVVTTTASEMAGRTALRGMATVSLEIFYHTHFCSKNARTAHMAHGRSRR
jgi:hypothetical protein